MRFLFFFALQEKVSMAIPASRAILRKPVMQVKEYINLSAAFFIGWIIQVLKQEHSRF